MKKIDKIEKAFGPKFKEILIVKIYTLKANSYIENMVTLLGSQVIQLLIILIVLIVLTDILIFLIVDSIESYMH